jgi:hypothetical protein
MADNSERLWSTHEAVFLPGVNIRRMQLLLADGSIEPALRGCRGGSWTQHRYTLEQVLGIAHAGDFKRAGCSAEWGHRAARWVSQQKLKDLLAAFSEGRTLLSLTADGQGRLVAPNLKPSASREQQRMVSELNLARTSARVTGRMVALLPEGEVKEAFARAHAALKEASERLTTAKALQDLEGG